MDKFYLKRGDTSPALVFVLEPPSTVLSGATVVFNMRNRSTSVVAVSRAAAVIVTATGTPTVRYDWAAGDTATAGAYDGEFEITYSDLSVETFPNASNITIVIAGDIA